MAQKKIVDGNSSSGAWQRNESGIAIWPIGAFEQHGYHLPLAADNIQAEYAARFIAEELGAALLPCLPFGTSLEHKGFRGTITLTPELLMSLVRHMVAELQAQNFTRLIIVNGHGGNFSLGPVVRSINRDDRNIKILIVNWWEFRGKTTQSAHVELHAGEFETSIMLHIAPEKVGNKRKDFHNEKNRVPFKQGDLNAFGIGRINPEGTWGIPSKGTPIKGKKLVEHFKKTVMPYIYQNLARWDKGSRYGGPGPVILRPMLKRDIAFGAKLVKAAKWNQLNTDWEFILTIGREGSFVALHNGRRVGTATCIRYGTAFAWIGMVLVDPKLQRHGIGRKLLSAAVDYGKKHGAVRLDATPLGKKMYSTLGFKEEYELARMEFTSGHAIKLKQPIFCRLIGKKDMKTIYRYDLPKFGADRKDVLDYLRLNAGEYAYGAFDGRVVKGYCLGRHGRVFEHIGPVVADNLTVAQSLITTALKRRKRKKVIIDIVTDQIEWSTFLTDMGFNFQRPFIRMRLGKVKSPGKGKYQFAIAGPEFG